MPEFILDQGGREARERFASLDAFTQGYITAAFWLLDEEYQPASLDDLAPETWGKLIDDARDFQQANAADLARATLDFPDYDSERAGVDFWLTRNGHGAGFWDRGLGKVGDDLSEMARPYGSVDLYEGDDGLLYLA